MYYPSSSFEKQQPQRNQKSKIFDQGLLID